MPNTATVTQFAQVGTQLVSQATYQIGVASPKWEMLGSSVVESWQGHEPRTRLLLTDFLPVFMDGDIIVCKARSPKEDFVTNIALLLYKQTPTDYIRAMSSVTVGIENLKSTGGFSTASRTYILVSDQETTPMELGETFEIYRIANKFNKE